MAYILESFAMMLGLKTRALAKLRERFARQFGRNASDISIAAAAPHVRIPVMVVHDEEDNVVLSEVDDSQSDSMAAKAGAGSTGSTASKATRPSAPRWP